MVIKKCQWILTHGNKCRQPVEGDISRKSILTEGTKLYLCKKHRNSKNCKGYYNSNQDTQKKKKKDYSKTKQGKLIIKKLNKKKYFSRTGHPWYTYNATKKHHKEQLGQKFNLKYQEFKSAYTDDYNRIYDAWAESNYEERLTPMITKLYFKQPYSIYNFMWTTFEVVGYAPSELKRIQKLAREAQEDLNRRANEAGMSDEYDFL